MINSMLSRFREYINTNQFNAIKIGISSPEKIRSLSYGEVKKIETINYRTLKPERDGLFCARIFGPVKDWECNCGKYKRMKHRGVTCEKCGVEVIQSRVRRERMGHIELNAPVCHIWFLKGIPSYLGLILDMPVKSLERVIYYDAHMVIHPGKSPYTRKMLLSNSEHDQYVEEHTEDYDFAAYTGALAIRKMLQLIEFSAELELLDQAYKKTNAIASKHKLMRRIKVISGLAQAKIRPEWMVLDILPVLPPDLRPLVPLEGGRFASSDLNELYRRVLNRNIRLQRLMDIEAPEVIIKNEKRMLQESVDALIDNGRRGQPVRGTNKRPLKSLSEMLRGKQGRFRQNLLGKRVDYSGRSVIVVDPELKLDQCGLPKEMALELFKSHVYAELLHRELAANLRVAKHMVDDRLPEIWDVLADVVDGHPVLLNRAPTLHRLGIQAFYPILVDGKAIKLHPLVCNAFNADFDGDMMAVHVPLSSKAVIEAKELMLSTQNILSPANGRPLTVPSQDMVLGLHYITKARQNSKGKGTVFASTKEVVTAYQQNAIDLHAQIKVRINGDIVSTTVGRVLLYEALPVGSKFKWVNKVVKKVDLARMIEKIYYRFSRPETVACLDRIKELGFKTATSAGISIGIQDLLEPTNKKSILEKAEKAVSKIEDLYMDGIITNGERYNKIISIWGQATSDVATHMMSDLESQNEQSFVNKDKDFKPYNPIFMMLESGAKGSTDQVKQLVGMRGLMAKPSGEIMEIPVKSNFRGGLTVFEYFISTHGARKGQADTALKTANSGYLTRRLVDVAQDVVITANDCKTLGSVVIEALEESGDIITPLSLRVYGRSLATDLKDPVTGDIIGKQGDYVLKDLVAKIDASAVNKIAVRSVLTCQTKRGVCVCCYGIDLSKGDPVDIGATVGIIAAQSIGEPGTQLTMRTFHVGGTASVATHSGFTAKHKGTVQWRGIRALKNSKDQNIVFSRKAKLYIVSDDGRELQRYEVEYGAEIFFQDGQSVSVGDKLVTWDEHNRVIMTDRAGTVKYIDMIDNVTLQERYDEGSDQSFKIILDQKSDKYQPAVSIVDEGGNEIANYYLPTGSHIVVEDGQKIAVGDILVKMARDLSKTKDITGGLPRITDLFEARSPKDPAIIADADGVVEFGGMHRGLRKIMVVNKLETFDYLVPRGKQLNVVPGEVVSVGDQLTTGSPVLHDILRIKGMDAVQRYLVNQIQKIYCIQGVNINDRHVELIVRQMLRKVRIVDPGQSEFLMGDRVDRMHFKVVNEALVADGQKPAQARPVLMGITPSSLGTESFISAASFQETTRILTEAAISGQMDHLYGLKENVIIGKLIPAGTGVESFRKKYLGSGISELEQQARLEEQAAQEQKQAEQD